MNPVLKDAEQVRVVKKNKYFPGDIVAYFCPRQQQRVIHRVLAKVPFGSLVTGRNDHRYLIKADNGAKPDVLLSEGAILGKAVDINVGIGRRAYSLLAACYWFGVIVLSKVSAKKN